MVRIEDGTCGRPGPSACATGARLDPAGGCVPILPSTPCDARSIAVPGDETCVPIGVSVCADGFVADGVGGCTATLPTSPCADGTFAVPGETSCHEVSPCGVEPYPVVSGTAVSFVDAAATTEGDGTKATPFRTLGAALAAADATKPSTIALAAGKYLGPFNVDRPVRIVGRCPARVALEAIGSPEQATVTLGAGSELHGLSVTGLGDGVRIAGEGARLERVRVHDTGRVGVSVVAGSLNISAALVEHTVGSGVSVVGAKATLAGSSVRGVSAPAGVPYSRAILAARDAAGKVGDVSVRGSVLEDTVGSGVWSSHGKVSIAGSVVRRVRAATGFTSSCIGAGGDHELQVDGSTIEDCDAAGLVLAGGNTTISRTVVRKNRGAGVQTQRAAADATTYLRIEDSLFDSNTSTALSLFLAELNVARTIIRATRPGADAGIGIALYPANSPPALPTARPSVLALRRSLVEGNRDYGVIIYGTEALIEDSVLRGTKAIAGGGNGFNLMCVAHKLAPHPKCTVRRTISEQAAGAGVDIRGGTATLEGLLVRDNRGRGISIGYDSLSTKLGSVAAISDCIVTGNSGSGLIVAGARAAVVGCTIRDTLVGGAESGFGGYGIGVIGYRSADGIDSELVAERTLVERSVKAGVLVHDAKASFAQCVVRATSTDAAGRYGDGVHDWSKGAVSPPLLEIRSSILRDNARAGVSLFGAPATLRVVRLACNGFEIDVERDGGRDASVGDLGENVCGCGADKVCQVSSSGLSPITGVSAY